ncbi:hypothetical protein CPC08DRAFT_771262 [Agrocybe pediades]|nr:hypothetical protein CPC08DRAFT_771262 [Agrocybe pediades]
MRRVAKSIGQSFLRNRLSAHALNPLAEEPDLNAHYLTTPLLLACERLLPPGVTAENEGGGMYEFVDTSDPGLTGGPPFLSSVRPPTKPLTIPISERQRPMPRPIPKRKSQMSSVLTSSQYRIISSGLGTELAEATTASQRVGQSSDTTQEALNLNPPGDRPQPEGPSITTSSDLENKSMGILLKRPAEDSSLRRNTRHRVIALIASWM